jgi:STE24 endopeptidase
MNIYSIIILSTLLVDYIIGLISDALNLKNMTTDLPEIFRDVYEPGPYSKSQDYTRARTHFGLVTTTFNLIMILAFWFLGGFAYLDKIVLSWNLHPVWSGIIYIGILLFTKAILTLPFSIYSTFVIEDRFGFNKTTLKVFFMDLIKGFVLSLVIGVPLLAGVLAFFQYAGSYAWLYCWLVTTLFTLILQYVAPTWIMPLFNKFRPLEASELKDSILKYARSVSFPLSEVTVMDGSKRSTKSNAFFTGFGKNKRIALFDTLIDKHSNPEMVTILAHEIGHYKKKHILQGMIISILHMGVIFFLLSIFLIQKGLFEAFFVKNISIYTGLIFFGLLYSPMELFLSLGMNVLSRKNEYIADRFAIETTKDPKSFIDALKNLSVHNLSNLQPHAFYVFLNYSHPPVLQRIKRIQELSESEQFLSL